MLHTGSCHCGAVVIEVEAPGDIEAYECNCSMCERTGYLHLIVPRGALRLVKGQDALAVYTFNTRIAQHYFCKSCGCKPFYIPRSNPDGFSINVRCLDQRTVKSVTRLPFNGKDWESAGKTLAMLSHERKLQDIP